MSNDDDELTAEQLELLGDVLRQRLADVHRDLSASKEDARPVGLDLSIGRLSRVDALQQQHMAEARRQRLETQVAQIQQALGKLNGGTFGECLRCGEPIGFARLKVRPEASLCVRCQSGSRG
jgi:DnaK suppressor protein